MKGTNHALVYLDCRIANSGGDYQSHAVDLGIPTFGLCGNPERMGMAEKQGLISL